MLGYLIRRIIQALPVLLLITAIVFITVYLIPGDPAMVVLGQSATEANLAAMRERMGLNDPLPTRYWIWLTHVVEGDLGNSILSRQPVTTLIGRALPVTIYLSTFAMVIALLIAIPAGTIAALKRNTWADVAFTTWALLGVSIPGFWLALMLLWVFGVQLQWVPIRGYVPLSEGIGESLRSMVLPAFTLGVFLSGPLTRYLRSSILNTLSQEYVLVARAKGLSEGTVRRRHILRNSLIPFVTVIGVQFVYLLGGAVVIEEVYALPGIGRLAVNAIGDRDFPVVQGVVLVVACGVVAINLLIDLIYSVLDPRIRITGRS